MYSIGKSLEALLLFVMIVVITFGPGTYTALAIT
mgnify:CR=1 FL=1